MITTGKCESVFLPTRRLSFSNLDGKEELDNEQKQKLQ
jgi:hypothetical protein